MYLLPLACFFKILAAGSVYIGHQLNKLGPVYVVGVQWCWLYSCTRLYVIHNITADKNGCKVNVVYKPPEDGLVRAETYVGVKD